MLNISAVYPTIPVTDLQKAKEFYENVLGLGSPVITSEGVLYNVGQATKLYIYQREPSKADHTLASFRVDNIEQVMSELSQKGVTFEHYDLPGLKTDEKGIATMGELKAAWFKDPDGNILAISQLSQ